MAAEKSSNLVPRLRFLEFRDAGQWEREKLGSICELYQPETLAASALKQNGPYLVYGANGVIGKHDHYNHEDSEIVVTCRGANCGEVSRTQPKSWINGNAMVVKVRDGRIIDEFIFHSLRSNGLKSVISGSAQPQITRTGFSPFPLVFPDSKYEQEKIADCLGSLDDLIAATGRKLEALRQHKKGLMQQLFPQPGETVPRLRFAEFRDASAWSTSLLEEICDVLNKQRVPITTNNRNPGPYPYYGASGVVDYVDDYIFDERLILVGEDGAKWGPFEETAFIAEGKYWVNNHAHVLRSQGLIDLLLKAYLVRSDLGSYVTGAAPPKLTLGTIKRIPIPVPSSPTEQQKIADCLGSLDDLIAATGRKLEALRKHKEGLMQQLFPSLEGQ